VDQAGQHLAGQLAVGHVEAGLVTDLAVTEVQLEVAQPQPAVGPGHELGQGQPLLLRHPALDVGVEEEQGLVCMHLEVAVEDAVLAAVAHRQPQALGVLPEPPLHLPQALLDACQEGLGIVRSFHTLLLPAGNVPVSLLSEPA